MLKKPLHKSLIRRVIISVTLANLAFWLIACSFAAFVMYNEYGEAFDGTLQVTAERLLPLALSDIRENSQKTNLLVKTDNRSTPREYMTYQVFDRQGKIVMHSEDAPHKPYGVPLETGYFKTQKYRIYSLASSDDAYIIQVADKFSNRKEAATEAMAAMVIPALLLIPISIFAVAFLLKKQLVPIEILSNAIRKKDSGNMQQLETNDMPEEFLPIIQSVNTLMERLKAAFEAERSFTSNSAHEIRTPIAAALAHTQVLIGEIPAPYQSRVKEVENALQRLRRLSEKLLQLARADAHVGLSDHQVDLVAYIKAVIDDFLRAGLDENRLNIIYETKTLYKTINGDTFAIIIRNLIENALNHSPTGSAVSIIISKDAIHIRNDCEPVSQEEIQKFNQRFYRGNDGKEGSGLGLSIVSALADAMKIEFISRAPAFANGRGFEAIIVLNA